MPVKLNEASPFFGKDFISKATIKKMVNFYRANRTRNDGTSLYSTHFSATEVVELLVDNNIIPALVLTPAQQDILNNSGFKIYIANHANDPKTCPDTRPNYASMDTVILCTTNLQNVKGTMTWVDNLVDGQSSVSLPGAGDGLDKGTICPPDCPGHPDGEGYDSVDGPNMP